LTSISTKNLYRTYISALILAQRFPEALRISNQLLSIDPNDIVILFYKADCLVR